MAKYKVLMFATTTILREVSVTAETPEEARAAAWRARNIGGHDPVTGWQIQAGVTPQNVKVSMVRPA